ncbi:hypothetical protein T459_05729 [Capsicum annuum]|uniref:Terpene synthase metal-binding domain-containing protein n=1 Tax=Capsicum annuum TaxID=4072 RepID=A0A2G3A8P2_CAPAN|nr:hypothetical protein T459_05729 [Capsicum annuum]
MLLQLAKLNFNIIQDTHQNDLKDVIRWWRNLCIVEDLDFTRDRIVESFFFAAGIASEAQHGSMRKWLTKVIQLILIIDDVYDIYGSLTEVQQFTRAIENGSTSAKPCWWKQHGTIKVIYQHLKSILIMGGLLPQCQLLSFHVIFGLTNYKTTNETLDLCKNCQEIIYHTSVIIRLCNDQGTSTAELERGDVASSIICYMQEENVSEDVAREHIESIILNSWKKINYHFNTLSTSHQKIVKHVINEARMAHVMYHSGDGFGVQDGETQDQVLINLVEPLI